MRRTNICIVSVKNIFERKQAVERIQGEKAMLYKSEMAFVYLRFDNQRKEKLTKHKSLYTFFLLCQIPEMSYAAAATTTCPS